MERNVPRTPESRCKGYFTFIRSRFQASVA